MFCSSRPRIIVARKSSATQWALAHRSRLLRQGDTARVRRNFFPRRSIGNQAGAPRIVCPDAGQEPARFSLGTSMFCRGTQVDSVRLLDDFEVVEFCNGPCEAGAVAGLVDAADGECSDFGVVDDEPRFVVTVQF